MASWWDVWLYICWSFLNCAWKTGRQEEIIYRLNRNEERFGLERKDKAERSYCLIPKRTRQNLNLMIQNVTFAIFIFNLFNLFTNIFPTCKYVNLKIKFLDSFYYLVSTIQSLMLQSEHIWNPSLMSRTLFPLSSTKMSSCASWSQYMGQICCLEDKYLWIEFHKCFLRC